MTIDRAIEVFVHGFAFGRSFTHPFLPRQVEHGIWALCDAPRRSGEYRSEEYVARGVDPEALLRTAMRHTRGRFKLCVIRAGDEPETPIRSAYRSLGCRLMGTEPFMLHRLETVPVAASAAEIVRVVTIEQAELLAQAARRRQILPRHLSSEPPPMRQYMALVGGAPVGWVGSVAINGAPKADWCASLFVDAAHRRRGIATALMARMLHDGREAGASASVLLASHAGARLYPSLGYESLGELLLYAPPKRGA